MSLNSMLQVELQRDVKPKPTKRVQTKNAAGEVEESEEQQKAKDLLIAAVPTEVLAPYTALVGLIVSTIDTGESPRELMRWIIYFVGLLAIFLFLWLSYSHQKDSSAKRTFPIAGIAVALVAFAAWGLVMPGSPLSVTLSGDDLLIWTSIITVGGGFLVSLMTRPLQSKTREKS